MLQRACDFVCFLKQIQIDIGDSDVFLGCLQPLYLALPGR